MNIVLFGGCFDLLHSGHVQAIQKARSYGYLVLYLASDKEITRKKGRDRPIIPFKDRLEVVKSLKHVNEIVSQSGYYNPRTLLKQVKPDILILNQGQKYPLEEKLCKEMGITIKRIKRFKPLHNLNTTGIIAKIRRTK